MTATIRNPIAVGDDVVAGGGLFSPRKRGTVKWRGLVHGQDVVQLDDGECWPVELVYHALPPSQR